MTWRIANISTEDRSSPKCYSLFEFSYFSSSSFPQTTYLLIECRENRQKTNQSKGK